ncbi:MAG: MFS transporter [Gemmatimonadaceae bacterium]
MPVLLGAAARRAARAMTAGRQSINPFRALQRHRNFRIFWTGQTVSVIGTWMQSVAQGWLALELTNDAFMVGLVTAVQSLPILLFSLWAGVLADRYDKLRLITVAQSLLLLEAALLWWFAWSGNITIGWLLALAFSAGVFAAIEIPARQALLIELVGREDLVDAVALNSSGFNLARIIGPGIAAFVIATVGLAWCFGINALSYLAVLAGLLLIRLPAWAPDPHVTPALEGFRQGIAYMRETREVAVLMRLVAVFSICGVPYLVLMPVYAREVLSLDASGYARLLILVGVGAMVGALALAAVGRSVSRGLILRTSAMSFAVALIALAMVDSSLIAQIILFVAGFAMIINNALSNGLLQSTVPDALRGRVMSAYTFVFVGMAPVGAFGGGAIASAFGVRWAIGGAAALMLAYAVFAFARHPELRSL